MATVSLTRRSGQRFWLDSRQIESMETDPDSRLHLVSGEPVLIREGSDEVITAIIEARRRRVHGLPIYKGRTGLA